MAILKIRIDGIFEAVVNSRDYNNIKYTYDNSNSVIGAQKHIFNTALIPYVKSVFNDAIKGFPYMEWDIVSKKYLQGRKELFIDIIDNGYRPNIERCRQLVDLIWQPLNEKNLYICER